jgi:BirA family biotin operon repressor/biotin-[acetyl-CoA-carboxylase] ligase
VGSKGEISKILRAEKGVVSGASLSDQLGISRVSIWKHIHQLQQHGYDIRATAKGYQLAGDTDALHPWEFPEREDHVHCFEQVDSTMDIARNLARKGCPHFTVIIADRQRKGRGRLKRRWLSDSGGLYFTVVLRPLIPPVFSPRINLCASLTLAKTLNTAFSVTAAVKWPNDVLVDDKKISGMLSEMEAEADRVAYINVGMGINVNNDPSPLEPGAVSLKEILGRRVSRKKLLARFLDAFEDSLTEPGFENVVAEWKQYTVTLKRHVKIVTLRDELEGEAVDVDQNGSLILRLSDGSLKTVSYGDCFHL